MSNSPLISSPLLLYISSSPTSDYLSITIMTLNRWKPGQPDFYTYLVDTWKMRGKLYHMRGREIGMGKIFASQVIENFWITWTEVG